MQVFVSLLQTKSKIDLAFSVPLLLFPRFGNMYHEPLECVRSLSGPSKQVRRVELRVFSSIVPSSLALPPEMAFQRATGGVPVHITVYRGLAKQLAHLHAAAVHTQRDPSARAFVIALHLRYQIIVSQIVEISYCYQIELLNHAKIDKFLKNRYFLKIRVKFYTSRVITFRFRFINMNNRINRYANASHEACERILNYHKA